MVRTKRIKKRILIVFVLPCIIIAIFIGKTARGLDDGSLDDGKAPRAVASATNYSNDDVNNRDGSDWNLILVNAWNEVPDDYKVTLMELKNGHQVDERIYSDLQKMFDAAKNEGIYPHVNSSYRTSDKQQSLYSEQVSEYVAEGLSKKEAEELAKSWVAVPGTSEHQIGLALDINADKDKSTNDVVYAWLHENSYQYGFIMRYPADKVKITGVNYEPWHYRYVGKEVAKEIVAQGVCLEEYLDR